MTTDRALPHDLDAERAVLGAILLHGDQLAEASEHLTAAHFYRQAHRQIFEHLTALATAGTEIDYLTLVDALGRSNQLEDIGGRVYLTGLVDGLPARTHIAEYARIVREKADLRAIIQAAGHLQALAFEGEAPAREVLDRAEQILFEIAQGREVGGFKRLSDLLPGLMAQIEAWHQQKGITGLPTGLQDFDNLTRGLQPANLILIAARPSMGKAQPLDAMVLASRGFVRMGDLAAGDLIQGPDGRATRVTAVHDRGRRQVYRVEFIDGRSTEACAEHLWTVHSKKWAGGPRQLSTEAIAEKLKTERYRSRMSVDLFSGEYGGRSRPLPIDPWLLGVLLGDGCFRGRTDFTTADRDLALRVAAVPHGCTLHARGRYTYRLTTERGQPNPLRQAIRSLGLWNRGSHHKFIPDLYFTLAKSERLALLRGLLDTDGWTEKFGAVRFCTTSARLANDVVRLARSVGAVCALKTKARSSYRTKAGQRKAGRTSYTCTISYRDPRDLFTLDRKRQRVTVNRRRARLTIRSVTATRLTGTRCISVDRPDGLYVTDDFIVTHNSALALNIAQHCAGLGKTVGLFSLEMSEEELGIRTITAEARVDGHRLQRGYLGERDFGRLSMALGKLGTLPIFIDATPFITIFEMRSRARRLKAQAGLDLLIVDYMQLMEGDPKAENRNLALASISRGLKALAKDLNIPVIVLSQVNRQCETRQDKRPLLADLRDSGALEQDADLVVFIYRDEVYNPGDEATQGIAELILAKQRNGPIGTVKVCWLREFTRFESLAVDFAEDRRLPMGER